MRLSRADASPGIREDRPDILILPVGKDILDLDYSF